MNRNNRLFRLYLLGTILCFVLVAGVRAAHTGSRAAPGATDDDPELFVSGETMESMTLAGGVVYWSTIDDCPGFEFLPICQVHSKPAGGGATRAPLDNSSGYRGNDLSSNVAADDRYIYWINEDGDVVRMRHSHISLPTIQIVAPLENSSSSGQLAVDGDYVYWTENLDFSGTSSDSGKLFRAPKEGGARQLMHSKTQTTLRQLRADGVGGALYIAHTCGGICFPDVLHRSYHNGSIFATATSSVLVQSFTTDGANAYWATTEGVDNRLHLRRAPLNNLSSATEGPQLWPDDSREVRAMAADGSNLYWHLYHGATGGPINRLAKSSFTTGAPTPLTTNRVTVKDLLSNGRYLFWHDNAAIYRLATNAAAYQIDASIAEIEVTQGIQNLDNDVPLVHKRWTMVRVYPGLSTANFDVGTATVRLHGSRGGSPLPGSPLTAQHVTVRTAGYDRALAGDSANFVLPTSWREGEVSLTAELSVFGVHDTNLANNSQALSVSFTPKSNICIKFLPLSTTSGLNYFMRNPASGNFTPGFLDIVDRFHTLWPTPDVLFYSQGVPLRKPCVLCAPNPPFNMASGWDRGLVLHALWEHNLFDEAPSWCSNEGARTHYVGMVNPGIPSENVGGLGRLADPLSWAKMRTNGTGIDQPRGGGILVHEVGHNHNGSFGDRWNHIDCGLPADDDPYDAYPYNPATIGPTGARTFWGFDRRSNTIVQPDQAADYMSYCMPAWVSDHNWRGAMDATNNTSPISAAPSGGDLVFVSGNLALDETSAELILAYRLPAAVAGAAPSETPAALSADWTPDGDYVLQLVSNAGAVLASQPVTPMLDSAHQQGVEDGASYNFMATMPDAPTAALLRLMRDGSVVAQRAISGSAPVVSNVTPAAGGHYTDTLPISWQANDPDGGRLHFVVQYSPDGGASWQAIATGLTQTTLHLDDASYLAGSDNALIRVIANDGFNVGMATSGAFTLDSQAPQAIIESPLDGQRFGVHEPVILEGKGLDAEDGLLPGSSLLWQIAEMPGSGATGEQLTLNGTAPGSYTVELTAEDGDGMEGSATASFVISPKRVYDGAVPTLDGYCDDEAYGDDLQPLAIYYGGGDAAAVRFVHASGAVYVCFEGLQQGTHAAEHVGLRLDVNYSGGATLGAGDRILQLGRDGMLLTGQYDGASIVYDTLPQGLSGTVAESGSLWSAEMRVEEARWGGWNRLVPLQAGHYNRNYNSDNRTWPLGSSPFAPGEWGLAALGRQSQTITFAPLPDMAQEAGPLALDAASSSGLPVSFTSLTPGVCEVGGSVVDLLSGGTCTVRAAQPGDDSYLPAAAVTRSFAVTAATGTGQPGLYLPFFSR